ncbi:MAG TPA: polysaccharide pyruvyl transferase family protein [Pyrinomonadaceae bacterium]|nr:polysaccharide pyruvyl transferase family protein [Pyrinomonadaceae bacterium]
MLSAPRLLVIADVGGQETRHIGDEAMLEANLDALRRLIPDVSFTIVSRDPAWTATRYGVDAVAPFGFPGDVAAVAERSALLERLVNSATASEITYTAGSVTSNAMARADALVVSGGGNLSSTWPDLLYERVALLQLARIFGKPAVVLGQTLGPVLSPDERRLLAETLPSARIVGLRELPSAALARDLNVPADRIWHQCDDALFPAGNPDLGIPVSKPRRPAAAPYIAVTLDPQVRTFGPELFNSVVAQLRDISEKLGASIILIPHAFGNESRGIPSDLTEAFILADRLGLSQSAVAAGLDANQVRQLTAEAVMVISSRYHPIVFGLAAGVPSLGIYGDEYCRIKLEGALAHAGLEQWTLTYDQVAQGSLLPDALKLWQTRREVRNVIESRREAWREESRQRWRAVIRALDPATTFPLAKANRYGEAPAPEKLIIDS